MRAVPGQVHFVLSKKCRRPVVTRLWANCAGLGPQSASCRRGDQCPFSHGVFESWLHPSRYRTQASLHPSFASGALDRSLRPIDQFKGIFGAPTLHCSVELHSDVVRHPVRIAAECGKVCERDVTRICWPAVFYSTLY